MIILACAFPLMIIILDEDAFYGGQGPTAQGIDIVSRPCIISVTLTVDENNSIGVFQSEHAHTGLGNGVWCMVHTWLTGPHAPDRWYNRCQTSSSVRSSGLFLRCSFV